MDSEKIGFIWHQTALIYGFLPIHSIIVHMTVHFLQWCANGTEIHKYLGDPYTIHKCLNIVRMSIFYYIFSIYISMNSSLNWEVSFK